MYFEKNINGKILRARDKKFTPNKILLYDEYAEIILYNVKNIECARALISLDKVELARQYAWSAYLRDRSCYAITKINGTTVKMHNILFNPPSGLVCDHINQNGLDNRNENIRFCTHQQNSFNVSYSKNCTSGCRGVHWNSKNNKWRARIKFNGRSIEIGSFDILEDAIAARKAAEIEYFGEYAPQ